MPNKKSNLATSTDLIARDRYFEAEFRAEATEDTKRIIGRPAVYGQTTNIAGLFYEIIERGAFDEADFSDVLFFINHNVDKIPLARSRRNNGSSTMQITSDEQGLMMDASVDTDNHYEAKALYSAVGRADIKGMSFMFKVKDQKWENLDSMMPTRRILKIAKVFEVSAVNFPAYEGTDINARDARSLDSDLNALDNARAALDNASSERMELEKIRSKILGG